MTAFEDRFHVLWEVGEFLTVACIGVLLCVYISTSLLMIPKISAFKSSSCSTSLSGVGLTFPITTSSRTVTSPYLSDS